MRTIKVIWMPIAFLGLCLSLWGCAWNHYTEGSVFDASDVNQIVKGKTTTTDLMNILGTPYSKTPIADGGEQWFYFCSSNLDTAGGVPTLMVGSSTKQQKNITILVNEDKIVMDYKLGEGPIIKTTEEVTWPLGIPIVIGTQTTTNSKPEGVSPKN
jgi:outer membrane protein assembly factor BamE (lipoprotein component of BamABCDE complex)